MYLLSYYLQLVLNAAFKLFELTFQMSYQNYPLIIFLHEKMEKLIPKIYRIL